MRFVEIPEITYINKDGVNIAIKDIRPIEHDQIKALDYRLKKGEMIDEIITRRDFADEESEHIIYKTYDFNIANLVDNKYNVDKLKILKIPV